MKIYTNIRHVENRIVLNNNVMEFPLNPRNGQIAFVDGVLYIYSTIAGTQSWHPLTKRSEYFVHDQEEPSDEWVINHKLKSRNLAYFVYDIADVHQIADITFDDENNVKIKLVEPITGRAVLFAGSGAFGHSKTSSVYVDRYAEKQKNHGDVEGEVNVSLDEGMVHRVNLLGLTAITFSGWVPGGYTSGVTLSIEGTGPVTWPENILWPDGIEPELTEEVDRIYVLSDDEGATLQGFVVGTGTIYFEAPDEPEPPGPDPDPEDGFYLYSWGSHWYGELGQGHWDDVTVDGMQLVNPDVKFTQMCAGDGTFAALDTEKKAWWTGVNCFNENGSNSNALTDVMDDPNMQTTNSGWDHIAVSSINFFGIKGGALYGCGWQRYGCFMVDHPAPGWGSMGVYLSLHQVGTDTDWAKVWVTEQRTMFALKTDGTLWSWGYNGDGNLGIGTYSPYEYEPQQVPISAGVVDLMHNSEDAKFMALDANDEIWWWGYDSNWDEDGWPSKTQTKPLATKMSEGTRTYFNYPVPPFGSWKKMFGCRSGTGAFWAQDTQDNLWVLGVQWYGELGVEDSWVKQWEINPDGAGLKAGHGHCENFIAVKDDGTLWMCGDNWYEQIAVGGDSEYWELTQAGTRQDWADVLVRNWVFWAFRTTKED
jgi:alpha-tubulin suppressor-like RCC1 family protein